MGLVTEPGGLNESSFNGLALVGLSRAAHDLDVKTLVAVPSANEDAAACMERLAGGGCALVIAVGESLAGDVRRAAARHPRTRFAIVDAVVPAQNVRSLVFRTEQAAFLAGALAARMTRSRVVGFVGGRRTPAVKRYEAGFRAGAARGNYKVKVLVAYAGGFDDPSAGKRLAAAQFDGGADVVFHAAGGCGIGVIEEVRGREGCWAIGSDSEQDGLVRGRVLVSVLKRVDVAVLACIHDLKAKRFQAGTRRYDLRNSGVAISDLAWSRDSIPPRVLQHVQQWKEQVRTGRIVVPERPPTVARAREKQS